jgi:hypothetical protein
MARSCSSAVRGDLLVTLDHHDIVDEIGRVHEGGVAELAAFQMIGERMAHRALRHQPDGGTGEFVQRLLDIRVIERGCERGAHEVGRCQEALDPAPHRVARRRVHIDAEWSRRDHRHQIVLGHDHRRHGAVAGRHVGEPFDIAAGELVRVLHHENVDAALRHGGAHGRPTAFKLQVRNRADQPLGEVRHAAIIPTRPI